VTKANDHRVRRIWSTLGQHFSRRPAISRTIRAARRRRSGGIARWARTWLTLPKTQNHDVGHFDRLSDAQRSRLEPFFTKSLDKTRVHN